MSNEEAPWQRDDRLRKEEARLVLLEAAVQGIAASVKEVHDLLLEEKGIRRKAEEGLEKHMAEDNQSFVSIDSRLIAQQAQLSHMSEALTRIEGSLTGDRGLDPRLRKIEMVQGNWSAGWKALVSAFGFGAAVATVIGIAIEVIG